MEITTFGVKLDASGAKKGAAEVANAAKNMANSVDGSAEKVNRSGRRINKGFDAMRLGASKVGSAGKRAFGALAEGAMFVEPRLGRLFMVVRKGSTAFGTLAAKAKSAGGAAKTAGIGFKGMGIAIGTAVAATGVLAIAMAALLAALLPLIIAFKTLKTAFSLGSQAVTLAATAEQTSVAFEVLTGSAETAAKVIKDLKDLSQSTPLSPEEVVKAGRQLVAFVVSAEDVTTRVRELGDVSSGLGIRLTELSDIYGKAKVQGRLFAEDMNQFMGRGIPIAEALALTMGVQQDKVRGLVAEGKVGFPQLEAAFTNLTSAGGKFEGMLSKQAKTFNGMVSTIKGQWDEVLKTLGAPIRDALKPLLEEAVTVMGMLQSGAESLVPHIERWSKGVVDTLRVAFSSPEGLQTAIAGATDHFSKLMNAATTAAGSVLSREFELAAFHLGQALKEVMSDGSLFDGLVAGLMDVASKFGNALASNEYITALLTLNPAAVLTTAAGVGGKPFAENNLSSFLAGTGGGKAPERLNIAEELAGERLSQAMTPMTEAQAKLAEAIENLPKPAPEVQRQGLAEPIFVAPGGAGGETEVRKALKVKKNPMVAEAESIIKSIRTPGEDLDIKLKQLDRLREKGLLTSDQFGRAVTKAQEDYSSAMQAMQDAQQRLVDSQKTNFQRMMDDWGNLQKSVDDLATGSTMAVADSLGTAIGDIATGAKSAKDAWQDLADSVVQNITRMITQMMVQLAVQRLLSAAGGLAFHEGGVVGAGGTPRNVPPSAFSGAQKFHGGGDVDNLGQGEVPAILERGETVLTEDQASSVREKMGRANNQQGGGGGGTSVTVLNVDDPERIKEIIASNPDLILNTINRRRGALRRMVSPTGGGL